MSDEQTASVVIRSVSKIFDSLNGPVQALDSIDLEIKAGEFISIIGPSGCGKTTLLRSMAHLETPSSGEIYLNGKVPDRARLDRDFAFVFQAPGLLDWRNTLKNVLLPLEMERTDKDVAQQKAMEMINLVGLAGFEKSLPRQLSGGMQQRVSIARALTLDPAVLLMDEPFGALDQITRERMNLELLRIWDQRKLTVVFVTHNIREAILLSDRVVVMTARPGQIQGIIDVKLPRPRGTQVRETEEFVAYELEGEKLLERGMRNGN